MPHKCISIHFMYVLCVLHICILCFFHTLVRHVKYQSNLKIHGFIYTCPIKSLVSYRINVLWLYSDYRITGNYMVMLTYMTLIIVVMNYVLHITYYYCSIFYFVNCSLLSLITFQKFLALVSLIRRLVSYLVNVAVDT